MARLLVVDEVAQVRESLADVCAAWKHEVVAAGDGPDALAFLGAFRPDVLIVHLGLPGPIDGAELMRRIRTTTGWRPYVIALTGWARPQDQAQALSAGANARFLKPPDPDALRRTVARAVEKLRARAGR